MNEVVLQSIQLITICPRNYLKILIPFILIIYVTCYYYNYFNYINSLSLGNLSQLYLAYNKIDDEEIMKPMIDPEIHGIILEIIVGTDSEWI